MGRLGSKLKAPHTKCGLMSSSPSPESRIQSPDEPQELNGADWSWRLTSKLGPDTTPDVSDAIHLEELHMTSPRALV